MPTTYFAPSPVRGIYMDTDILSFSLGSKLKKKLDKNYDVIIVGGGPAGLTAAVYCSRALLKTAVISKSFGGQILNAPKIENYPGFVSISGEELAERFVRHAEHFGAELIEAQVYSIKRQDDLFVIKTSAGETRAKAVIYAAGSTHRRLDVPGEAELAGKGVSYCAVCDAAFFKDRIVAVVGGGNTAFTDAEVLLQHARKVYLIHRRKQFRAEPLLVERVKRSKNIELLVPYVVVRIEGKQKVERVVIRNVETGEEKSLDVDGVFVSVGMVPNTYLLEPLGVHLDEKGYVITNPDMSTNVPGLFAAGDVARGCGDVHQIVTAAAKGAIAALSAYRYIKEHER